MKPLNPLYFISGMTGMFSMVVPGQIAWLTSLPAAQSCALALMLSLALAALLTCLTQFKRRHLAPSSMLRGFAICGLLVSALLPATALEFLPAASAGTITPLSRLALSALFCLVAVKTQPARIYLEGAS